MSVHAGTILHLAGANVIDRIQSAGLGDVRVPIETIREVGNRLVVDKVPGEPDFTFTLETLDVSTDLMAWLTGKVGSGATPPGNADPAGTEYKWDDVRHFLNVTSPWKDAASGAAGDVQAGHLIPGYYPTRTRYRFGVTDNAVHEVELGGGTFYYAASPPVEEYATGDGVATSYATSEGTVRHRKGGAGGTVYRDVFGVIVDGVLMVEGVDYTVARDVGTGVATITFTTAPENGALIRFSYFTQAAKAFPQSVHPSTVVKPGAVRGRNIHVYLGSGGARQKLSGVQSIELEATIEGEVEREMGNDEPVGRTVNGTDCTGTINVRSKDADAFIALLSKVTGVATDEVFGFFNSTSIPVEIQIENPKAAGTIIKTLYVADGQFQPPGTPARVNTPTDFALRFDSVSGTYSEFKGAKP